MTRVETQVPLADTARRRERPLRCPPYRSLCARLNRTSGCRLATRSFRDRSSTIRHEAFIGLARRGLDVRHAYARRLLDRFTELVSLTVDQRVQSAKVATQLIENQRQLIATQQILIRLMERSIELTRHISSIEEKLPALYDLPRVVESLRQRIAQIEGVETY